MAATIRIGDILFDEKSGDIFRLVGGVEVLIGRLPPQPSQLLKLFVVNHPEMTSREAIQTALWPGSPGTFEKNMHFCVRKIRAALNDPASEARYLETIPRRGYRFVEGLQVEYPALTDKRGQDSPQVTQAVDSEEITASVSGAAAELVDGATNRSRSHGRVKVVIAVCLIGICLWSAIAFYRRPKPPIRVAIMTFEPPGSLASETNAIAELLLTRLTSHREPKFHVIGPTTTFKFDGKPDLLPSLVQAHSIDYVINGRFLDHEKDQLLAEIIRASDAAHVWVARFEWRNDEVHTARSVGDGFLNVVLGDDLACRSDQILRNGLLSLFSGIDREPMLQQPDAL